MTMEELALVKGGAVVEVEVVAVARVVEGEVGAEEGWGVAFGARDEVGEDRGMFL